MVQSYSPGGGHVSSHEGTLAPPGEYDWTCASFGPLESTTQTGRNGKSIGSAVYGRPFVKRFTLCYRTVVCLSVMPVTLVVCGLARRLDGSRSNLAAARPRPKGPQPAIFGPCVVTNWLGESRCHLIGKVFPVFGWSLSSNRIIDSNYFARGSGCKVLWWVCLCVCLSVCLSANVSLEPHARSLPNSCAVCNHLLSRIQIDQIEAIQARSIVKVNNPIFGSNLASSNNDPATYYE